MKPGSGWISGSFPYGPQRGWIERHGGVNHFINWLGPVPDTVTLAGPGYFHGRGLIDAEAAADLLIKDLRSGENSNHLCGHYLNDSSNDSLAGNNLEN